MNKTTTTTTTTENGELIYTIDEKAEKPIEFNHNENTMSDALGISVHTVEKYQRKGEELLKAIVGSNATCPSQVIENIYNLFHNGSEFGNCIMIERVMKCIVEGLTRNGFSMKTPKAEA